MEKELFARRCSLTGQGMNEGYCFGEGDFYCIEDADALNHAKHLGYGSLKEAYDNEAYYYTTWEEIDFDCFYDEEGNEYENLYSDWQESCARNNENRNFETWLTDKFEE